MSIEKDLSDLASDLNPKKVVKDAVEGCLEAGVEIAKTGIKAGMAIHDAARGESVTGLHIRDHIKGSSGHSFTGLGLRRHFFG